MHHPSKAQSLRCVPGGCVYSRDYVPRVFENLDYVFGSRTFSLLQTKSGGKTFSRSDSHREAVRAKRASWLQTRYGLSRRQSDILVSRSPSDILRIEETIHGIVDSLLLFDLNLFIEKDGRKRLTNIIRKTLTIGTYNVGQVVKYWKSFNDYLYNRLAGFNPPLALPSRENYFVVSLLSWPKIQRILSQEVDKSLLESFAHLSSSRQLPAGDKRAEQKALSTFLQNIENPYFYEVETLNLTRALSERLGEKCVSLSDKHITKPHISLSCAGSYYQSVKDGGRGKEIRDALTTRLTHRPLEDESIDTPFGLLCCPKGEERWRYWCRGQPYSHYPDTPFGSPIKEEVFAEQNLYYQGFDEVIGNQILVVAYLDYVDWSKTGLGIPCRTLTVPEPGFKARIVTTGPYWLNVLQQGLSHVMKDVLSAHPSVKSSLMKTDQAWQSLYLMSNKEYPKEFLVLSSDLKEATDHIPKVIALQIFMGFIRGSGIRSNLIEVCRHLLEMERTFISPIGVSERQFRGVMMGEPLTKVILTILNLVVEEYAMRTYLRVNFGTSFYESPKWRTYHIGGDDHLAVGPREYLEQITFCHSLLGSKISVGKHGISRIAVKYTEKVLDIRNIYKPFDVRKINDSTESYESSPFVDSIKVRLLSPTSKSTEVSSDRNIAIGKGLSLGRTLKWLNRDHFPTKWVRMVRNRFFERMGSLLPDRSSGVFWQLMLPTQWGGLDLYLPDEVEDIYSKLPQLTLSIMEDYLGNEPEAVRDIGLLRKFLTNYSYRGFKLNESEVAAMTSHLEMIIQNLPSKYWWEIKQEFDPEGKLSAKELSGIAYTEGWHMEEDILDELLRPILFKEILLGKERPSPYNTERLKRRYARLWDLLYKGPSGISFADFQKALKTRPQGKFYKVGYPEEIHFVSDRGYIYKSVLDDALHGMPILSIGFPYS